MTIPVVWEFPVKRPGFITSAQWFGGDADLQLQIGYIGANGQGGGLNFQTRGEDPGEICLPSSSDLNNLGFRARDVLVAHTRMACMIAGHAVPGSKEFLDAFIQSETNNLQTALGTVKVVEVRMLNDQSVELDFKQGTGQVYTVQAGYDELNRYSFAPSTQLLVAAGAIKKAHPTYVHNYPSQVLTPQQKDDIIATVMTLTPWI
jgi:hypothetical protein